MNNMNDKYDYGYSEGNGLRAKSCGHYEQKAYNPTVITVCEFGDLMLRIVKAYDTKYEILWNGELFNRYSTFKIAEKFFIDLTGLTQKKYSKLANPVNL